MAHVAIGFKPRTGRAVLVMLSGNSHEARVFERTEIPLLPAGEFATYHAAKELPAEAAPSYVQESIARAQRLALTAVQDAAKRCAAAGHQLSGCGVLVGTAMPRWTTAEILAAHARMHQAEGELFRSVLLEAVRACGFTLITLPDKTPIESAAKQLGISQTSLKTRLANLGRDVGAPWGQYQKEAAAAALVVLRRAEPQ